MLVLQEITTRLLACIWDTLCSQSFSEKQNMKLKTSAFKEVRANTIEMSGSVDLEQCTGYSQGRWSAPQEPV